MEFDVLIAADVIALQDDNQIIKDTFYSKRTRSGLEYDVLIAVDVIALEDDAHAPFGERYSTIMVKDAVGSAAGDLQNILKSQCPVMCTKKVADRSRNSDMGTQ